MNILQPIISAFLIVVMNISTIGIPLAYHYCGGVVEHIELASSVSLQSDELQDDFCADACGESCSTTSDDNQVESDSYSSNTHTQQLNGELSHTPCCADDVVVAKISFDGITSKILDSQIITWLAVSATITDYYSSLWHYVIDTDRYTVLIWSDSAPPLLSNSLSFLSVFRC
jgi:hypothetical protein